MNNSTCSIAEKFAVYSQLGLFDQWKFRHFLRWISQDAVSLEFLLDFERKLVKKSLFSWQILKIMIKALSWYNREDHDNRLMNRIQPSRLPEMLQIVILFLDKSYELHPKYRELLLNIIYSGDNFKKHLEVGSGLTPDQFRLEAAKTISNYNQQWGIWYPYLKDEADRMVGYLENIAYKVSDSQRFTMVCRDMAPVIGLKATSSLMVISNDFQEFESYFHRVTAQLKWWGLAYSDIFHQLQNASELNQILVFLETLTKDPRMEKCIRYAQVHYSGVQLMPVNEVKDACLRQEWERTSAYELVIDGLIDKFEQNIVHTYLSTTWYPSIGSHRIRWEFDKFTEYIPYEMRSQDWTVDNEKTRPYWNSGEAAGLEFNRFVDALKPRLCSIFKKMDLSEIEILFRLLPNYLGIQEFTKLVKVPVEWEKGVEWQEGYTKGGFYDEQVEVARPKGFVEHTFTFERPDIQNAIDLLDNMKKIREAIQAYRNSGD